MKRYRLHILIVFIVFFSGTALYFYKQVATFRNDPSEIARQEVTALVAAVGKLIDLPKDETPTLGTVRNPRDIQDPNFFKNAKTGDKILFYVRSGRAYLYDPGARKLLDVAPLNFGSAPVSEKIPTPAARGVQRVGP